MKQSAFRLLDIVLIVHHENHQEEQHVNQAVLDRMEKTTYKTIVSYFVAWFEGQTFIIIL